MTNFAVIAASQAIFKHIPLWKALHMVFEKNVGKGFFTDMPRTFSDNITTEMEHKLPQSVSVTFYTDHNVLCSVP